MLSITPLPALRDNYIWAIASGSEIVAVDPGQAGPVQHWLRAGNRSLAAILVTHHHPDHVGGVAELATTWDAPVYGPAHETIPHRDVALSAGDTCLLGKNFPVFQVLDIPGHTAGHIAYYCPGYLFCGDTLFSAGCGKLFEGTAAELYTSLGKLARLPGSTRVYPAHEYTVSNLRFARHVLPQEPALEENLASALKIRENRQPTLPTTIAREKCINLFLRPGDAAVKAAVEAMTGQKMETEAAVFAVLREWKDRF